MEEYRAILKRVGLVLIAVGLCDIIFMIYCVSQGQSYSSSFNIFAVIAGVLFATSRSSPRLCLRALLEWLVLDLSFYPPEYGLLGFGSIQSR